MTRLLLAVAAIAFVASGCGAAENDPNLAAAIQKTEDAGSSLMAIQATELENGKAIEIACTGKSDYERKRFQIACDYEGGYEMIVVGNETYMRGDVLGLGVGTSKWTKFVDDEGFGAPFSPHELLEMLRRASQDTRRIAEEDVRGVETVQYRLQVDCELAEMLGCDGTTPVDVWIDDDGLLRRIWIEDDSGKGAVEFYDFGADVAIEPPPADQVEDLDKLAEVRDCADAFGAPIGVGRALGVMRRAGLSVGTTARCSLGFASFETANRVDEGYVSCFLYESPQSHAPTSVRRRGRDGADAELALHNLECTILADSPAGEEKIDKLEAAFAELERTVRP